MLFKNILFASSGTAGSDKAAKLAFGLAEKQQAELTLYHCCGVPSRGFTTNVTDTRSGSLEQPDEAYQENSIRPTPIRLKPVPAPSAWN